MIAYLGNPQINRKADRMVLEAIRRGLLTVNRMTGEIFGSRWKVNEKRGIANAKGYIVFTLHLDGDRVQAKAHRAVWLAAHGNIPEGLMPDHKNRIKSDNRLRNLRLVTSGGNAKNRRSYAGEQNPAAKITASIAADIRKAHKDAGSYASVAARFGVSRSLVAQVVREELWQPKSQLARPKVQNLKNTQLVK